jgi:hypothetical protein
VAASSLVCGLTGLVLVGFCSAHNQPPAKEFLIVQFLHRTLRFVDGLHLHKSKTFRALIVPITYDLGILHVSDAIEQFEEIALGGVE